jgi:hypothetical protein
VGAEYHGVLLWPACQSWIGNIDPLHADEERRELRQGRGGGASGRAHYTDPMTTDKDEWHGWSRWDGKRTLHIGPLPGRKSLCLYTMAGSVMEVHAYFRSEKEARKAMKTLDYLMFGNA